jgi:hypothetical protein
LLDRTTPSQRPLRVEIDIGDDRQPILTETTAEIGEDGIARAVVADRDGSGPYALEHFFVIAPAYAEDTQRPGFEDWWAHATSTELSLFVLAT